MGFMVEGVKVEGVVILVYSYLFMIKLLVRIHVV